MTWCDIDTVSCGYGNIFQIMKLSGTLLNSNNNTVLGILYKTVTLSQLLKISSFMQALRCFVSYIRRSQVICIIYGIFIVSMIEYWLVFNANFSSISVVSWRVNGRRNMLKYLKGYLKKYSSFFSKSIKFTTEIQLCCFCIWKKYSNNFLFLYLSSVILIRY